MEVTAAIIMAQPANTVEVVAEQPTATAPVRANRVKGFQVVHTHILGRAVAVVGPVKPVRIIKVDLVPAAQSLALH
jgi:hypothetical protein